MAEKPAQPRDGIERRLPSSTTAEQPEGIHAAIYLRMSRDDQTTKNQRLVLLKAAEHRGWPVVQTFSGAKGRHKRPAFDQKLKGAVRRLTTSREPTARR